MKEMPWNGGFAEIVREGKMEAHIYGCDDGTFTVADQAGWLPGVFATRDEALQSAREANGLT
jgi:hypothetical protein